MKIISRKEAINKGLKRYFTGKPCKNGHIAERGVASYACLTCACEKRKKHYYENIRQERKKSRDRARSPKVKEQNRRNKQKPKYKEKQRLYAKQKCTYEVKKQDFTICDSLTGIERKREYAKAYYHANKEKIKSQLKSPERSSKRREYINNWQKKYRDTPQGKTINFMRKCLTRCLVNKNKKRTVEKLGYSPADLIKHIESKFQKNMSWDNYGEWHIDHIRPIKSFLDAGICCPKTINELSNLQPLWAKENLSKGARYDC